MLRKLVCTSIIIFFIIFPKLLLAYPPEYISNFSSIVVVNKDASIDVTENINAYVTGEQIKHGLVRWLPTNYVDSYGIGRHANYHIKQILVNNAVSKYHTENKNNQFVIYIGDKNILLEPGLYTFTIAYQANNAVNFFKDGDELYWNITGNHWNFPIAKADAIIQLPAGAIINTYSGYSGATGTKGSNFIARKKNDSQMVFATTAPLQPVEGLTVAVAWQKGIVTPPNWKTKLRQELNPGSYILIFLNALVFCYLLVMWIKHGKDPKPGTIIPLFEPPQYLSPEALRYIKRMGFDIKGFSAAVVSLAAKGLVTLQNNADTLILTKVKDDTNSLAIEEKNLFLALFKNGSSIELKNSNYEIVSAAKKSLLTDLKNTYQTPYFRMNTSYLNLSFILTGLGFLSAAWFAEDSLAAFFAIFWLTLWTAGMSGLFYNFLTTLRKFRVFKTILNLLAVFFTGLFLIPFLLGEILGIFAVTYIVPFFTMPLLFMLVVMNVAFYFFMRAPTVAGRKLMDEIEGFKMFLATTEQQRLDILNPPNITPEVFETYLPYAIALDVENEWGEHFNNLLNKAGREPTTYQPYWYTGTTPWSSTSSASIPLFIGTALASSLASASVSSSSSGSGGGGFSGGGGGGGGGGGW